MKIWKRYDTRLLTKAQQLERVALRLSEPEYRLFVFIRDAKHEGVSWGSLPARASHNLLVLGLIGYNGICVWAKEYAP